MSRLLYSLLNRSLEPDREVAIAVVGFNNLDWLAILRGNHLCKLLVEEGLFLSVIAERHATAVIESCKSIMIRRKLRVSLIIDCELLRAQSLFKDLASSASLSLVIGNTPCVVEKLTQLYARVKSVILIF